MRLSEMTDEQLIQRVEGTALAREIFNRLVLSKLRVSDEVQALEHQRDKAQSDYEKAMDQVGKHERLLEQYREQHARNLRQIKQFVLSVPEGKISVHDSHLVRDLSDIDLRWYTEERHGYEGWFLCVEEYKPKEAS